GAATKRAPCAVVLRAGSGLTRPCSGPLHIIAYFGNRHGHCTPRRDRRRSKVTHTGYEANGKVLVLSADVLTHTVSPDVQIDHVTRTKIYGDGRVVFIDPAKGDDQIFEGKL